MHLFQNIGYFVIWLHQPTFEYQERSFIVEACMALLGELPVAPQGKIALMSEVDFGQPRRTRWRGHQGRKRSRNAREGIRDKVVLAFGMNDGDTKEEPS